jgi:uroporphyrinogen decarboxylase
MPEIEPMTPKDCLLTALRRGTPQRIPTFEWFIDTAVIQALCGTDDPIEGVEQLDIDGINIRPDYGKTWKDAETFIDDWGIERRLTGDMIPHCTKNAVENIADWKDYTFPDPQAKHRFATLERALEKFGDNRAVVLNIRDGFYDMRDLLGYEQALTAVAGEKAHFAGLLKRVAEYNLTLAEIAVKRYGIQIVATTDDVCTARGPIISPKMYRDIIYPAFYEVMQGFRSLGLLIVKHCDGDIRKFLDLWISAGIHCLDPIDPGGGLDMGEMRKQYGDKIALKGNIDCTGHLVNGTPEQVEEEVRLCIEKSGTSGLILSSSNTIHRGVKPENYRAMLTALRKYGSYTKHTLNLGF